MKVLAINGSPRARGISDNAIACRNPCKIKTWNPSLLERKQEPDA